MEQIRMKICRINADPRDEKSKIVVNHLLGLLFHVTLNL